MEPTVRPTLHGTAQKVSPKITTSRGERRLTVGVRERQRSAVICQYLSGYLTRPAENRRRKLLPESPIQEGPKLGLDLTADVTVG